MMLHYYTELINIIIIPIVTIILLWTIVIFHKNRKRWAPYDIPIVAVLIQSIIRNLAVLVYTVLAATDESYLHFDYCSAGVWLFNSLQTFQATCLTTLAVIGIFSIKLYRKQQNLKQFLTSTHIIYHLFCLTTLCACVGVAAILAQQDKKAAFDSDSDCQFLPFQLDVKFYVFILVLHIFLVLISFSSFIIICYHHYKIKRKGFDYLKKSTSDLSDLSLGLSTIANPNENVAKNYYDTYTIPRNAKIDGYGNYESHAQNGCYNRDVAWNSDLSNISTTVSSTNSRRPCLARPVQGPEEDSTGMETVYPVLIVSYFFNHLPVIVLCIFPYLISPLPVATVSLWLGLLQDLLIPISLVIIDSRFTKWVSKVYRCSDRRRLDEKLPHVGPEGKFRHFGSQPQSLEVSQVQPPDRIRNFHGNEPKFPITNGSLYTSIDGRLPIIHNYRRHKDHRGPRQNSDGHILNLGLHATHLKRKEQFNQEFFSQSHQKLDQINCSCSNCEPKHPHQRHITKVNIPKPNYVNSQLTTAPKLSLNHLDQKSPESMHIKQKPIIQKRVSVSQTNLRQLPVAPPSMSNQNLLQIEPASVGLRKLHRDSRRLSKSEDSLNELQKDLRKFKQNPQNFRRIQDDHAQKSLDSLNGNFEDYLSSDDEYFTDSVNMNDTNNNFNTLSSDSSYSITTEANCDFDFYQNNLEMGQEDKRNDNISFSDSNLMLMSMTNNNNVCFKPAIMKTFKPHLISSNGPQAEPKITRSNSKTSRNSSVTEINDIGLNFRITRSNSKRSLENLQAYLDENKMYLDSNTGMQRSNSFVGSDNKLERRCSANKFRDVRHIRNLNKSVDSFKSDATSSYFEGAVNKNIPAYLAGVKYGNEHPTYGGSVPDFKKIFISEYI